MNSFLLPFRAIRINLLHLFFQVLLAAVAAHTIVLFGEPETFSELWQQDLYQPAFVASWLIAFGLVGVVDRITAKLAKVYPWQKCWPVRLVLQMLFGLVLVCALAIAGAWCYFYANGVHIKTTAYFSLDFLPILLFVLFLNAGYSGYNGMRLPEEDQDELLSEDGVSDVSRELMDIDFVEQHDRAIEVEPVTVRLDDALLRVLSAEVVAQLHYVFVESRCNWAMLNDGRKLLCPGSMEQIMIALPADLFCQINQSCIIARKMIEKAEPISSRRYALTLHQRYEAIGYQHLKTVSQRFAPSFRSWW